MEYIIAYARKGRELATNQAIANAEELRESAHIHTRYAARGVVYVYERKPREHFQRGRMAAIVTSENWYDVY